MPRITRSASLVATLALASAVLATTSAYAETVILSCVADPPGANICPSHWIINSDTQMVTWRWCKSKDTTEQRNVVMTPERITFDEDFMDRHYIFDRMTGRMTLTAVGTNMDGTPGERFDDGEAMCRVVQK